MGKLKLTNDALFTVYYDPLVRAAHLIYHMHPPPVPVRNAEVKNNHIDS